MNKRFKTLSRGIIDVSPLMIPVVPFGIIYGVIGMEVGLSAYMTFGMSIIIFGGASQIVLLQLFSGGASSLVAITSVTAVNSRHLLYGAVFSEYLSHLKLRWKIILSYVLIDQAFAVSNIYFKKNKENNCNNTICEAPPKTIIDIPKVIYGPIPNSIPITPNIIPKGTTGIMSGLTSSIPLPRILSLVFIIDF